MVHLTGTKIFCLPVSEFVWKVYHLSAIVFISALVRRKLKSGSAGRSTKAVGEPVCRHLLAQTVSDARVSGFPGWLPGRKAMASGLFFGNLLRHNGCLRVGFARAKGT